MILSYVTDARTEALLALELGDRARSWIQDVSPYEFNYLEDIMAAIPDNTGPRPEVVEPWHEDVYSAALDAVRGNHYGLQ